MLIDVSTASQIGMFDLVTVGAFRIRHHSLTQDKGFWLNTCAVKTPFGVPALDQRLHPLWWKVLERKDSEKDMKFMREPARYMRIA
jgi:hypothetical protein